MDFNLPTASVSRVAILGAALELQLVHGTQFARQFLEPYQFDEQVVKELLEPWSNADKW